MILMRHISITLILLHNICYQYFFIFNSFQIFLSHLILDFLLIFFIFQDTFSSSFPFTPFINFIASWKRFNDSTSGTFRLCNLSSKLAEINLKFFLKWMDDEIDLYKLIEITSHLNGLKLSLKSSTFHLDIEQIIIFSTVL